MELVDAVTYGDSAQPTTPKVGVPAEAPIAQPESTAAAEAAVETYSDGTLTFRMTGEASKIV